MQKKNLTADLISECLSKIHAKVSSGQRDMSIYIGGPASNATDTTSGQVTSLDIPIMDEEVYASWIGDALGLTVQGGLTILIDSEEVLLATYDGWFKYRRFLDQNLKMEPRQINTWNGQWVAGHMAKKPDWVSTPNKAGEKLETQSWIQLLFALSFFYSARPTLQLMAYVYSMGQTNTTVGFVRLNLQEVRSPFEFYRKLFRVPDGMPHERFRSLYDTEITFRRACESAQIGLRAIEPKDVFNARNGIPKKPNSTEGEKQIAFDTYQSWIVAMLNSKELFKRAGDFAETLNTFRQKDERGKTVHENMVKELLTTKTKNAFVEQLTKLVEKDASEGTTFYQMANDLMSLPNDSVPLFITLLRFQYAVVKSKV